METKICRICLDNKELNQFVKHKGFKSGIDNICKDCNKIKVTNYRINNREKYNELQRNYLRKRREALREIQV